MRDEDRAGPRQEVRILFQVPQAMTDGDDAQHGHVECSAWRDIVARLFERRGLMPCPKVDGNSRCVAAIRPYTFRGQDQSLIGDRVRLVYEAVEIPEWRELVGRRRARRRSCPSIRCRSRRKSRPVLA